MEDPPAGWLVIVDGPGKGRSAVLGYGMNSVGRDATERVALDHGDRHISRKRHVVITYDSEIRKFHIRHGDGINLVYVNDQAVHGTVELLPFAHIRIGKTKLRFVPLCGEQFCWEDKDGV